MREDQQQRVKEGSPADNMAFGAKVEEAGSEGPDEDWMCSSVSSREEVGFYPRKPDWVHLDANGWMAKISDAEEAEVEAKLASDLAACDIGEPSLADTADMAWEPGQELADNDTIEVRAAAENDVTKARVGTGADSCGSVEGGGRIAPAARTPYRVDVVHCVTE